MAFDKYFESLSRMITETRQKLPNDLDPKTI